MGLSIDSTDVKAIAGIGLVIAGLLIVGAGIWRADIALITLGAGLLGAPGVAAAGLIKDVPAVPTETPEKEAM